MDPLHRKGRKKFMKGDRIGGPIRWRMHLAVPPEKVFAALDSDDGRAAFWAESAVEVEAEIVFRFVGGYETKSPILGRRPTEPRPRALLEPGLRRSVKPVRCLPGTYRLRGKSRLIY